MKKIFTTLLVLSMFSDLTNAQSKTACLDFDGVNDKVLIPHDASLNLGRSAFTIEAWIAASPNMSTNMVLAPMILSKKGSTSPSTDGLLFGLTDQGKMAIQIEGQSFSPSGFGGGPGVPAQDLRTGAAHHIAWTREVYGGSAADTVNGYQDAAFVKKSRLAAGQLDISNNQDLWIGGSDFNTGANIYWFEGQIKEIRIWDHAKTESQIQALKGTHLNGSETGLLFYWRMNENDGHERYGDTIYDCGPSAQHGIKEGPAWATFITDVMDALPANTCTPDTNKVVPPPTGIDKNENEVEVVLYPNPIVNELKIITSESIDVNQVTMYDMNGKVVLNQYWKGQDPLNVSLLESGMYMLQLSNGNKLVYKSIVMKE